MIDAFEVVPPLFHRFHNGQELPIVSIVVLFGRGAFSGIEGDRPKSSEPIVLVEDASNCKAACISLQDDWLCWVEMLENWYFSEHLLKLSECMFGFSSPFPCGR